MELKLDIPENINVQDLFGNYDSNVRKVEKLTGTEMTVRDGALIIKGKDAELAMRIIGRLIEALRIEPGLEEQRLNYIIDMEAGGKIRVRVHDAVGGDGRIVGKRCQNDIV